MGSWCKHASQQIAEVVSASEKSGPALTPERIVVATARTVEIFILAMDICIVLNENQLKMEISNMLMEGIRGRSTYIE